MQLECCQTEMEFVCRRLKQTEEKLETERQTRQELDAKVRQDAERWTEHWWVISFWSYLLLLQLWFVMLLCFCEGGDIAGPAGAVQEECDRGETSLSSFDLWPSGCPGPYRQSAEPHTWTGPQAEKVCFNPTLYKFLSYQLRLWFVISICSCVSLYFSAFLV